MQPNPHDKPQAEKLVEEKLGDFSQKETENLVSDFQECFDQCVSACKKPNILVTGITGSGKSTLVNAVFGEKVCDAGVGLPVTQHFEKFEPENLPLVLYDSKGLEWDQHETWIRETSKFFAELRAKKEVSEHIHCVWYVINAGRGRIDDFEINLLREVISPTPVLFILNKADLADSEQLKSLIEVIRESDFFDEKKNKNLNQSVRKEQNIFVTVSNRKTYTQGWCPKCFFDDVFYDEETKELECVSPDCGFMIQLEGTYGLEKLVEVTTKLLPEFAKDAFSFCQKVSQKQKDRRAFEVVSEIVKKVSIDLKGGFIKKIAEMCAKMFVIWGYPLTADAFREEIGAIQSQYVKDLNFKQRFLISSIDTIFRKQISKCFTSILGMTMNRGMKLLNKKLIQHTREGNLKEMKIDDFMTLVDNDALDGDLMMLFFEDAFFKGVNKALEKYWSITREEVAELKKKSKLMAQMEQQMQQGDHPFVQKMFGDQHDRGTHFVAEGPGGQGMSEEEVMNLLIQMSQQQQLQQNPQQINSNHPQMGSGEQSGVKIEFLDEEQEGEEEQEEEEEEEKKEKKKFEFSDDIGLD